MKQATKTKDDHDPASTYLIPQRRVVAGLVLLAGFNLYLLRYNLSSAIISMSNFNKTAINMTGDVCVDHLVNSSDLNEFPGEFDWDETDQGHILGAFFYGHILFQVVGGRLSEIFGAKWLCGGGIAVGIALNALKPVIVRTEIHWLFLASRVVLGIFSAMVHPAFYTLFSKWSPDHERSTVLSLPQIGGNLGTIAASGLSGYLAENGFDGGWASIFYVSAMISCVWLVVWTVYVRSEPKDHPWISEEEKKYIEDNIESNGSSRRRSVPWLKLLTSLPVWSTIVVKFTVMWNYLLFMLKLPAYLQTVFEMSGSENGLITSMIYLVLAFSMLLSGIIADKLVQRKLIRKTLLRKIFELIASFGSSLCLVIIPSAGCNEALVIALLFIGSFLVGFMAGGDIPVISDMTTNFSATVFALANTAASLGGILIPLVSGIIVDNGDHPRQQWGYIFYLSAGLNLVGGLFYAMFGSAERQQWDKEDDKPDIFIERL